MNTRNVTTERILEIIGNSSQVEFAESVRSSQSVISKVMHGEPPSLNLLVSISQVYKVSIDWILGMSQNKYLSGYSKYDDKIETTYGDVVTLLIELLKNGTISSENDLTTAINNSPYEKENEAFYVEVHDKFIIDLLTTAEKIMNSCPESIENWRKSILNNYNYKLLNWTSIEQITYDSRIINQSPLEILKDLSSKNKN